MPGRIEEAVRYSDAGRLLISGGRDEPPFAIEGLLGNAYQNIGQPERTVAWCRAQLARGHDTHALTTASLVFALSIAGCGDESRTAATGLIEAAEATRNPFALSFALLVDGFAFRDADPARALDAARRGMVIAQDSGNRFNESQLAIMLSHLEAEYGDPRAALDYASLAIRNYHDSGNTTTIRSPLAILAVFLDRLGRYEPAATIAGFAVNPFTSAAVPAINTAIAHLRAVLDDPLYESLAHDGESMTTAAMATYAYDQINQTRAALDDSHNSK